MRIISSAIKWILFTSIALFAILNLHTVDFKFFIGKDPIRLPLFLVIIISFFLGGFFHWMLSLKNNVMKSLEIRSLKKQLTNSKEELEKSNKTSTDKNKRDSIY